MTPFKMTNKSAKSETRKPFFFFFHWHANEFSSKHVALKVDVLQDRKIHCLQVCPCIFQPRNFTGWGSEGVNVALVFLLVPVSVY